MIIIKQAELLALLIVETFLLIELCFPAFGLPLTSFVIDLMGSISNPEKSFFSITYLVCHLLTVMILSPTKGNRHKNLFSTVAIISLFYPL